MSSKINARRNSLLFTTALTTSLFGYYNRAEAACSNAGGTSYLCEDANSSTINLTGKNNANVSTANGFEMDVASGNGIVISGDGALSFTDNYASIITINNSSGQHGIYLNSTGDDGGTAGSINITSSSVINASGANSSTTLEKGTITALNQGSGSTNIEFSGNISANALGMYVKGSGGDISITTSVGSTIDTSSGDRAHFLSYGIKARQYGQGDLIIETNGSIFSNLIGIDGRIAEDSAGEIFITTGAGSVIESGLAGISIIGRNEGTINLVIGGEVSSTFANYSAIDINGSQSNIVIKSGAKISGDTGINTSLADASHITLEASAEVTSTAGSGGTAIEFGSQNDILTINGDVLITGSVAAGSGSDTLNINSVDLSSSTSFNAFEAVTITDSTISNGIDISNTASGSGLNINNTDSTSMTVAINNSNITSASGNGVSYYTNSGGSLSLNLRADSSINSYLAGLLVEGSTANEMTLEINGDITSTTESGIDILQTLENDFSLTIGNTSTIVGAVNGVQSHTYSTNGSATIAIDGNITGQAGIGASIISETANGSTITIGSNSSISGSTTAAYIKNVSESAASTITIDGYLTGANGAVIKDNSGANDLTINIGSQSEVRGSSNAIDLEILGTGETTFNISGEVISDSAAAIYTRNSSGTVNINVSNGGSISGTKAVSSDNDNVAFNITLDGTLGEVSVTGDETAIEFGSQADNLTIIGDVVISGNIDAGEGYDTITLGDANLTFTGEDSLLNNFESLYLTGSNLITGTFDYSELNVTQAADSTLYVTGNVIVNDLVVSSVINLGDNADSNITADSVTIDSGGKLKGNGTLTNC
jgi:fibronectin-binding autotransporter adhesin